MTLEQYLRQAAAAWQPIVDGDWSACVQQRGREMVWLLSNNEVHPTLWPAVCFHGHWGNVGYLHPADYHKSVKAIIDQTRALDARNNFNRWNTGSFSYNAGKRWQLLPLCLACRAKELSC
jgi:hypothetical protein